ncbi:MAG: PQQ-binding-like beta-propeller repeat protein [Planctomycetia bacterium]|nr:PQQ-binding-like beta-propeller repeat protein [Planctomycetia bacterium]
MKRACCLSILIVLVASAVRAADWPCWRGPQRTGISPETGWLDQWPKDGPPVLWKASVGTGFSSLAVAGGKVYTLGNRDNHDTVWCFDAESGKQVWAHRYEAPLEDKLFEGGPTSTPTVDGDRVYTLSRWGDLFCFDAASGKVAWSKNVHKETSIRIPGWGYASSPVIHENQLLLNIGEAGVALDKRTGKLLWASGDKDAGYSSPVLYQRGTDTLAIFSADDGYTSVDLKTGKPAWNVRWLTRFGLNAAEPILTGDTMFISSGYGKGGGLFRIDGDEPKEVWRTRAMRNQFNSCVLLDGFLYGIDGDTTTKSFLKCVELKTGEAKWSHEGVGMGSLMIAAGRLIVLSDQGELLVAPATPEKFAPTARAKVLEGKCWTVPVLANGRIYCRNAAGDVICVDVRAKR